MGKPDRGTSVSPVQPVVILLASALLFTACKKISPEARALLVNAGLASKERAVSWSLIAKAVKAKDSSEQLLAERFAASHGEGLAAQAKALSDLLEASQKGGTFSDRAVGALVEAAATARARAEVFRLVAPRLELDPEFVAIHEAGLVQTAVTLGALADALKQDKPAPAPEPGK